ncbi:hypothetical protein DN050_17415 [Heyndrickxia coagulans]|nr:hypothetical protein DN050_17415 [Heyndrickxia coagulans]
MTHLQFNLNLDVLKEAIMTSDLDAVIKSAVVLVLNEFMEKERDDYLKTSPYERAVERRDYRNGYYERELLMSIGNVTLKVPRTRNGEFSTTLFEKYARCDQAFENIRMHIRSTNSLERLNQEVRRRERVIRIFPNTQSAFRLVGAVLMQYQDTEYSKRKSLMGKNS